nr:methyltransferase domain-containing protein [Salipaludibacillus keqinensis]
MDIKYINSYSEDTLLETGQFDYVTVLRAWHWFDSEKTLSEVKRLLKNDGTLLVMDSGFLSKSKLIKDTLEIIKGHMPTGQLKPAGTKAESKQTINGFPIEWFQEWKENNFDLQETYKFTYTVSFSAEEWCGRVASLSWLTGFTDQKRTEILDGIYNHVMNEFGEIDHPVEHGCYVTILNKG